MIADLFFFLLPFTPDGALRALCMLCTLPPPAASCFSLLLPFTPDIALCTRRCLAACCRGR